MALSASQIPFEGAFPQRKPNLTALPSPSIVCRSLGSERQPGQFAGVKPMMLDKC